MRHFIAISCLLVSALFLSACGSDTNSSSMSFSSVFSGGPSLIKVTEPREGAFTVMLPEGWESQVALLRPHEQTRSVGFTKSPDGSSCIFFGDANLPMFYLPSPAYGMSVGMNTGSPLLQIKPFVPADRFFTDYVQRQYGRFPGFRITGNSPDPRYQARLEELARKLNMNPQFTTTSITFEFTENGKPVQAQINGTTFLLQQVWVADLFGYITSGDPQSMDELSRTIANSFETVESWQEQERIRGQEKIARMDAMTRQSSIDHQNRMANMQSNFNAHQRRMQTMQETNDIYNQTWSNNQASQDRQHERFIDGIRGEETVTNGSYYGKVESGYNEYYVNPNTGDYIGTNNYENPDVSVYELWTKRD